LSELEDVYGGDVITLRAVQKWTAAFDAGRTQLDDLPRSGRRRDIVTVDAVRALIEEQGYRSQKSIAQMLGIYHETLKWILYDDLQRRRVNFKWVPHAFDAFQKAARVEISRELLAFRESRTDRHLCSGHTGDETWVYPDNRRASLWIGSDVARPNMFCGLFFLRAGECSSVPMNCL
jgi:hypothetical protein